MKKKYNLIEENLKKHLLILSKDRNEIIKKAYKLSNLIIYCIKKKKENFNFWKWR